LISLLIATVIEAISAALIKLAVVVLAELSVVLVGPVGGLLFANIEVSAATTVIDCNVRNDGNISMIYWFSCVPSTS